uniref:Uncharacterized protein MANES_10G090300 n=1 Tax=Rhizophora mucronata TaxID=61149 RepID=A0A2P2IHB1_RHIMU
MWAKDTGGGIICRPYILTPPDLTSPIHHHHHRLFFFFLRNSIINMPPAVPSPYEEAQEHLLAVDIEDGIKLRIRNLTRKSDGGTSILHGINMDIPKGVIVGIMGPSGSGKSTVLRALNRLWEPPAGTVFLDGRDIRDLDVLALRRKVGMLFQLPALFEGSLTVFLVSTYPSMTP